MTAPEQPLRVLHVHSGNMLGGVEAVMVTLAERGLGAGGLISAFALCFDGALRDRLVGAGAHVALLGPVRVRQPWTIGRARRRLVAALQRQPSAVITHSAWSHALFAPVVQRAAIPLVFWMHGPATGRHWLERWARRTPPDFLLANSRFTASTAGRLFPGTRAEVVHPPVVVPSLPDLSAAAGRAIRESLQTPADATVVIQVGRLEEGKGHHVHLEALARVADRPDWICWMVGGAQRAGEERYLNSLRRRAQRLGIGDRVRFTGHRPDVGALLAAADIYCQPNTVPEGFGLTLVEALDAGLPVITAAFGGGAEIVDDTCGVLCDPGDVHAVAAALRGLIDDPAVRRASSARAVERARALCDPDRQIHRVAELLHRVARRERAGRSVARISHGGVA